MTPFHDILVHDTTVLTMVPGQSILEHRDVFITGAFITAIKPSSPVDSPPALMIDGSSQLLMPGFINTHTHVGQTFMRSSAECMALQPWLAFNQPHINSLTREDVYWAALLAIAEMIQCGITTFADMFFFENAIAEAVLHSGIRAVLGQGIMQSVDGANGYAYPGLDLKASVDFATRWNGGADGRIVTRLAPHSLYTLSEPVLIETAQAALDLSLGVHTHVSETSLEVENCKSKFGATPPSMFERWGYLEGPFLAAHCVHLTPDDVQMFDQAAVGIAHNPSSNLKLRSGRMPLPLLAALDGMSIGLGTDSAASNDSLDLLKEAQVAAIWHDWENGTPAARICLDLATHRGARALGLDSLTGTVEVNKRADLILLDLSSPRMTPRHNIERGIIYAGRGSDVRTVIVDGNLLMHDREMLTIDVEEIIRQADKRAPVLREIGL